MNKDVYILPNKSKKSFKVIDLKTNEPWANEVFKTDDEAVQFCKDNKLKIKEIKIFEKRILAEEIEKEDSGQAIIYTVSENFDEDLNGIFIRIQSWDENKKHKEFNKFIGRKVKITIETID